MTAFYKLSGAGNDFVALVEPAAPPAAEWIEAVCSRGVSIGADGVLLLYRQEGGARLVHYNNDGRRSDFCLNGSRSAAQLAFALGWREPDSPLALETDVGVLACRHIAAESAEVGLPPGLVGEATARELWAEGRTHAGYTVKVGVPHFVLFVEGSLAEIPVLELGARLRHHADLGPGGANVNFARILDPGLIEIRTFERGVEGETLACGSGVCATVRAGLAAGRLAVEGPIRVLVAGGFELEISVDRREGGEAWRLAGDARVVARGELPKEAAMVPRPARWSP